MPTKDIESLLLPWYLNSRPKQRFQSRAGVHGFGFARPLLRSRASRKE